MIARAESLAEERKEKSGFNLLKEKDEKTHHKDARFMKKI